MDLAVLTLFDPGSLADILDGYDAITEMRERAALPLYQAVRGAGSFRWLETHHYGRQEWAINKVKGLAAMA